jgi:hypothetical protein
MHTKQVRLFNSVHGGRGTWQPYSQNQVRQLRLDNEELQALIKVKLQKQFKDKNFDVSSLKPQAQTKFYAEVEKEWLKVNSDVNYNSIPAREKDTLAYGSNLLAMAKIVLETQAVVYHGDEDEVAKNILKVLNQGDKPDKKAVINRQPNRPPERT